MKREREEEKESERARERRPSMVGARRRATTARPFSPGYDTYSGSMRITTHLDPISHFKTASGINWSNRWTYRAFIKDTRRDSIVMPCSQAGVPPPPQSSELGTHKPVKARIWPWSEPFSARTSLKS